MVKQASPATSSVSFGYHDFFPSWTRASAPSFNADANFLTTPSSNCPSLAPIKCAIFPLVNKDGMPEKATALYRELKPHFAVVYDDKGSVGRRYRRQDEAGTPFCVTIDGDTAKDDTVTLRDRDSRAQERVKMSEVRARIEAALAPQ